MDECKQNPPICVPPAECHNTVGSYYCQCPRGYVKKANSNTECEGIAKNVCILYWVFITIAIAVIIMLHRTKQLSNLSEILFKCAKNATTALLLFFWKGLSHLANTSRATLHSSNYLKWILIWVKYTIWWRSRLCKLLCTVNRRNKEKWTHLSPNCASLFIRCEWVQSRSTVWSGDVKILWESSWWLQVHLQGWLPELKSQEMHK